MILGRKGSVGEVRAELQRVLRQVGFDLDIALVADADTLVRMIAPTGELEPARGWLVAEAMYLDGLEAVLDGRVPEARHSLEKALRLYQMFDASTPVAGGFPEAEARVREIEERLRDLDAAGS